MFVDRRDEAIMELPGVLWPQYFVLVPEQFKRVCEPYRFLPVLSSPTVAYSKGWIGMPTVTAMAGTQAVAQL